MKAKASKNRPPQEAGTARRIYMMDELRGFAVFCMVFYHGFYTMASLFQIPLGAFLFRFFMPAEPWFAGLFICIAGVSSELSHSNLLRGAKLLAVAAAVTAATLLVVPQEAILFGILHFLSLCMLGFGLLQLLYKKFQKGQKKRLLSSAEKESVLEASSLRGPEESGPKGKHTDLLRTLSILLCAVLYFLTMNLQRGYIGIPGSPWFFLPSSLYKNVFTAALGFPYPGFASSDYFPIFPWCFVFAAGTILGRLAQEGRFPAFMYKRRIPFFSFLGQNALLIYVLHQPVIYGICYGAQAIASLF